MPYTLGKGLFDELRRNLCQAGPALCWPLKGAAAAHAWRDLMGATNPADAAEGTLRKDFASSIW